jgi:transcriptional regulator with XRE-family HTH domain
MKKKRPRPIHANIKRCRLDLELTQEDLGQMIGESRIVISHWETGPNAPRVDSLPTLADALQVTIDELVR